MIQESETGKMKDRNGRGGLVVLFRGKKFGPLAFLCFFSVSFILLLFIYKHFGLSAADYIKFLFGILLVVYIPGQALCWLSKVKIGRVESVAVALALGLVSSTAVYKTARIIQLDFLFFLWLSCSGLYFLIHLIKNPPRREDFSFSMTPTGIGFLVVFLCVFAVLALDNYRNGLQMEDGSIIVNMRAYDGFRQNALVRELSHSVPPQMPWAAGYPLSYHYGMDLFTSIFYRYLHLEVLDLNHRLVITFFFVLLVLTLFSFIKELSSSEKTALLGTFLVIFGSGGLAYAATYLLGISQWGNIFYSFYFFNLICINSFLPALGIISAGFFCLLKYLKSNRNSWLVLTGLLFALCLEFKMFFSAPLIGALFCSGIIFLAVSRNFSLLKVWLLTTIIALPFMAFAYLNNQGGPPYFFKFKHVDRLTPILNDLEFLPLLNSWGGLIHHSRFSIKTISHSILSFMILLLGSFGLSFLALPSLAREFISLKKIHPGRLFLIALFGASVIAFFSLYLSLGVEPRNYASVYFYFLAVVVLCVFWAEKLIIFLSGRKMLWRTGTLILVIMLSIPNTARFFWSKIRYPMPRPFSASFIETSRWINRNLDPEAIILHPHYLRYACYFTDRRVVLDISIHSYLAWHLTVRHIRERDADIRTFFSNPSFRGEILKKYGVTHIWMEKTEGFPGMDENLPSEVTCYSDLGTKKILKYQKSHHLELVYQNEVFGIYSVREAPENEREIYILDEEDGKKQLKKFVPPSLISFQSP